MTSIIIAVIMALSPTSEAQDGQVIAAKPDTAVEEPRVEPKIHQPEKAIRNFHQLLKKDELTFPGIVIEETSKEK